MQQVAAGKRFWWRALDAQTPEPPVAPTPPPSAWVLPAEERSRAKEPSLTLKVPRGERKHRGPIRRVRRSRAVTSLFALSLAIGACGAAAVTLASQGIDLRSIATSGSAQARAAMIGLGFGIDQVNVTGQRYSSDRDIFDALDLPNVRTFADFDSAAALKRIERIPWIDTAQITRSYPSTLDVVVKERTPAVLWARGNQKYFVDATGRVLGLAPATHGFMLPEVSGEGANAEANQMIAAVRKYPELERNFEVAERVAERRWRIVLRSGSIIELAADREIEGLSLIEENRVLRRALSGAPVVIDVRTPGRVAVRPANGPKSASAVPGSISGLLADRR